MSPTWTILIPTLARRRDLLTKLLDVLLPQVDAAGGSVKILACWDNGEASVAAKKQALLTATTTDYLSFVDDDDLVSDDYVPAICDALDRWPDYVGLKMQVYMDGRPLGMSHHSLSHGGWIDDRSGDYRRDITCANPMRTTIAQTARFDGVPRGQPEDVEWARQLRAGGQLRTEVFVDRVLYHYLWVPSQSAWTHPARHARRQRRDGVVWPRLEVASPNFAWLDLPTEGDVGGGPAGDRSGADEDVEHRAPDDGVDQYAGVGYSRPPRGRRR